MALQVLVDLEERLSAITVQLRASDTPISF